MGILSNCVLQYAFHIQAIKTKTKIPLQTNKEIGLEANIEKYKMNEQDIN